MSINDKDNIRFLLDYCSAIPDLYNRVANHLYVRFGLRSAEISLLVTYYVNEEAKKHGKKSNFNL